MKLWAVRGATTIGDDTPGAVIEATQELLEKIFEENQIAHEEIVSIFFTVTPDIQSEFPAVGARNLGLNSVPLMCAQEISKIDALPRCIRVLINFYTELTRDALKPVYLREAVKLRPDLNR